MVNGGVWHLGIGWQLREWFCTEHGMMLLERRIYSTFVLGLQIEQNLPLIKAILHRIHLTRKKKLNYKQMSLKLRSRVEDLIIYIFIIIYKLKQVTYFIIII